MRPELATRSQIAPWERTWGANFYFANTGVVDLISASGTGREVQLRSQLRYEIQFRNETQNTRCGACTPPAIPKDWLVCAGVAKYNFAFTYVMKCNFVTRPKTDPKRITNNESGIENFKDSSGLIILGEGQFRGISWNHSLRTFSCLPKANDTNYSVPCAILKGPQCFLSFLWSRDFAYGFLIFQVQEVYYAGLIFR